MKKMQVLDLRPTQICLGLQEVENKVKKLSRMKGKGRAKYIKDRTVPVVLGPNKEVYLIDHHHFARACWEVGIKNVFVKVVGDFSKTKPHEFWHEMDARNWVYPYDQYGETASVHYHLPDNIKGLADDPFRSLAWMVREKGGFAKVDEPFSEFRWADFFRHNMNKHPRTHGYPECVKAALRLCRSKDARHLPGYK